MRKLLLAIGLAVAMSGAAVAGLVSTAGASAPRGNTQAPSLIHTLALQRVCPAGRTLWAVVNSNGTLARSNVPGTTSRIAPDGGTGDYEVMFPFNIRRAAYAVSPGDAGALGVAPAGQVSVQGDNDNVGGVFIGLRSGSGAVLTDGLHLIVAC